MADLDSFFAKKDKKKLKGKKFTTTDEIAKRLEHTAKKIEKNIHTSVKTEPIKRTASPAATQNGQSPITTEEGTEKEKSNTETAVTEAVVDDSATPTPATTTIEVIEIPKPPEEEQWNDFQDDTVVDVSNLKITKLNIDEEDEARGNAGEGGEDGKDSSGDNKKDGVWKIEEKKQSAQSKICEAVDAGMDNDGLADVKAAVAAMAVAATTATASAAKWTSSLKQEAMQPSLLPRGPGYRGMRKKCMPDINNSMAFPSLADSQASSGTKKKTSDDRGADVAPSGGMRGGSNLSALQREHLQSGSPNAYRPPMLRTNNRYNALTDHGCLQRNT